MLLRSHASHSSLVPSRGSAGRWIVSPRGRQLWEEPDPRPGDSAARKMPIDLTGDVALQDPDDVPLGSPFLHSALEIVGGLRIMGNSDHDDAPQGAIGLPVATLMMAEMSGGLPRTGRHR